MSEYSSADEVELMRRVHLRDELALGELYDRYSRFVFSLVLRTLGNDLKLAEEATQDTFLKAWNNARQWDPQKGRLGTWLLAVARYTAIDLLRKEQRHPAAGLLPLDDFLEALPDPSLVDDPAWHEGRVLRTLLRQIPIEQVQVIELAYYYGMSHTQIAEHLQLPLGTVKTRISLGLRRLKDLWLKSAGHDE